MTSVSASQSLNLTKLFKQASIDPNQPAIADALLDASKKIALKPDDVQKLVSTLDGLKPADKKAALDTLGYFQDRFDIADAGAKKLFDQKIPLAKPKVGGRTRTVAAQQAQSKAQTRTASAKDIKATDAAMAGAKKAAGKGGDTIANEMNAARNQAAKDGDFKPNPEDGRKAWVQSNAANPPPPAEPAAQQDPAMSIFDQYARSPFFEDRLMAALGKAGLKFMKDMNKKLESFDDPNREAQMRQIAKDDMGAMLKMANAISPAGKARIAEQIQQFATAGGADKDDKMDAQLKAWLQSVPKADAGKAQSADDILKTLPPPSNSVVAAMLQSDKPDVRGWGAVFQASDTAEQLKGMMDGRDPATMGEDELRNLVGKGHEFQAELHGLQQFLPDDVKQQIGDVQIQDLPKAIDPTSRQVMFQQINLMMNQYQQIMQAFSEIINKLNEMAMDPIRKIGR